MNSSIGKLVEEFDQARIATASNLLGHSVLVPGNIGRADDSGELHGVLDLPESTISTEITYRDADTNEELQEDLGPRSAGLLGFKWSNIPEELLAENKRIKIEALIDTGSGPEQLSPSIYSKVISASVGSERLSKFFSMLRTMVIWMYRLQSTLGENLFMQTKK